MSIIKIAEDVAREVQRAQTQWAPIHSAHEAAAVIKEEYDEFWEEVRKREHGPAKLRKELIHTAAMCVRAIVDLQL